MSKLGKCAVCGTTYSLKMELYESYDGYKVGASYFCPICKKSRFHTGSVAGDWAEKMLDFAEGIEKLLGALEENCGAKVVNDD